MHGRTVQGGAALPPRTAAPRRPEPAAERLALAYRQLAGMVRRHTARGARPTPMAWAMLVLATSGAHRGIARALRAALAAGDVHTAHALAAVAQRPADRRAEKLVSARYRLVWLCNPKVASRSLIRALSAALPDAVLFTGTIRELHRAMPETRRYVSFAFVRDPYTRAHSFYADKLLYAHRKDERFRNLCHGLADVSFDALCAWLNTACGADAFADRHWLSQHRQIRLADGRLPDHVGRYEHLEADLARIAARIGFPLPSPLPVLNTMTGWTPVAAAQGAARRLRAADLTARNRALLAARYADDFAMLGYRP